MLKIKSDRKVVVMDIKNLSFEEKMALEAIGKLKKGASSAFIVGKGLISLASKAIAEGIDKVSSTIEERRKSADPAEIEELRRRIEELERLLDQRKGMA